MYPVKDSAERGLVFSEYSFREFLGIPNKLNWSITIGILFYYILLGHYIERTIWRLSLSVYKVLHPTCGIS